MGLRIPRKIFEANGPQRVCWIFFSFTVDSVLASRLRRVEAIVGLERIIRNLKLYLLLGLLERVLFENPSI